MRKKRFSILHLLLAVILTLAAALGGGWLILREVVGENGLTLLEGLVLINSRFVGEYDETEVVDSAMRGMVAGLGDRWSYYLTETQYTAQEEARENLYVGIGVTVSYEREEGLLVLEVVPGSPAEEAGLLPGELITGVDGTPLAGEARYSGPEWIKGASGTMVSLELLGTDGVSRTAEVVRRALMTDPVSSELRADGIGYVAVSNFYERSADRLKEAVEELQAQGARALVFDMRDNGGGYLSQLTDMLDFLLPEGPIFRSGDRSGKETVTESDAACVDLPMAVLVNANTYSAAEFFAAELQEWGVAVIVGEKTSGKGYSQQTFALPGGGAIAISTGTYATGSGVSLIGAGLTLDREVAMEGEGDPQLDAAVELLLEKLNGTGNY